MLIDPKFYVLAEEIRKALPPEHLEDGGINLPKIGAIVAMAGNGDHLDIGTGFGGSAIMAAMVKREFGLQGKIQCIDPYPAPEGKEGPGRIGLTMQTFNDHAVALKVAEMITLTPAQSFPLPKDIADKQFVSGYIDGDKNGMAPWMDFMSVRGIVMKYLMFGGFEEDYPSVMAAVVRALSIGGFILHYKEGNFVSFRRPVDIRGWTTLPEEERQKRRSAMWV